VGCGFWVLGFGRWVLGFSADFAACNLNKCVCVSLYSVSHPCTSRFGAFIFTLSSLATCYIIARHSVQTAPTYFSVSLGSCEPSTTHWSPRRCRSGPPPVQMVFSTTLWSPHQARSAPPPAQMVLATGKASNFIRLRKVARGAYYH
jgi:hypothetical protein